MDTKDLLRRMSENPGVSGYESQIAEIITSAAEPIVDSIRQDKLGNVIMFKKGNTTEKPFKVMLAAHMDEIGLIVTKVEKEGFLRFSTIGGFDQRTLLGQEVIVHGSKVLPGVIGAKPPHVQTPGEQKKSVPLEELFIDVGLSSEAEVSNFIAIGDLVTIDRDFLQLQGSRVAGKAMDDRAGVASIIECFKELSKIQHKADVYGIATVQEEVGLRGAITSTYGIVPDVGIAVDVGFGDMPGLPESDTIKLSNGPAIALGPHVHPKVYKRLVEVAKEWNIAFSLDPSPYPGGTDAYAIQVSQSGVPSALLSIPLRYMHTPIETLDFEDARKTGRLMALFIAGLDTEFVEGLHCF